MWRQAKSQNNLDFFYVWEFDYHEIITSIFSQSPTSKSYLIITDMDHLFSFSSNQALVQKWLNHYIYFISFLLMLGSENIKGAFQCHTTCTQPAFYKNVGCCVFFSFFFVHILKILFNTKYLISRGILQ